MQFVNSSMPNQYFKYMQQSQKTNSPGAYIMPIRHSIPKSTISQDLLANSLTDTQTVSDSGPSPVKKMRWGEPTWFLFHTLAHKLKDEYFNQKKNDLLAVISTICSNLPCPDCATHASEYMKNINFNSIKTKQDLKLVFFQFHNVVSQRKGLPLFSIDDLDPKYSMANTSNIIQNFMYFFQDKHFSIRMIANDMYRAKIISKLKGWFNDNIQYFDP